jgi:hypothetical protein
MRRFRRTLWLVPPAFALHVAEEAPGFTRWVNRNITDGYTRADFVRNNAAGVAMTLAGTWALARRPGPALAFVYFAAIVSQQTANAAWHAGATAAYRDYSPGLASALLLFLPLQRRLARLAHAEGILSPRASRAALALAAVTHAQVIARQVHRL